MSRRPDKRRNCAHFNGKKSSAPCHHLRNRRGVLVRILPRPEICSFLRQSVLWQLHQPVSCFLTFLEGDDFNFFHTGISNFLLFISSITVVLLIGRSTPELEIKLTCSSQRRCLMRIDSCPAICSIVSPDTKKFNTARPEVNHKEKKSSDPTITYQS